MSEIVATQEAKDRLAELLERDSVVVISEGTLRPEDLAPKFCYWLGIDVNQDALNSEFGGAYTSSLFDALAEMAPEGFYLGTIQGDGACFGFYKLGDED